MSYSRWGSRGSGHWYTYWCVQPPGGEETFDNALFDVCMVKTFTAKELRTNIDNCLSIIAKKDSKANKEKLNELKTYMQEFLIDVNKHYNE